MTEFESRQGGWYAAVWVVAVLCILVAVLASGDQVRGVALVLLVVAVAGAVTFSKVTIIVRPATVTFAWAPWRWPRSSYPLAGLRAVRVIDKIPSQVRNRRRPSARVFDCGRGPAIELEFGSGRRVFATVDDPEAASNAIQAAAGLP